MFALGLLQLALALPHTQRADDDYLPVQAAIEKAIPDGIFRIRADVHKFHVHTPFPLVSDDITAAIRWKGMQYRYIVSWETPSRTYLAVHTSYWRDDRNDHTDDGAQGVPRISPSPMFPKRYRIRFSIVEHNYSCAATFTVDARYDARLIPSSVACDARAR